MEETIGQFISFLRDIKHVSENTAVSYRRDLMKMRGYFQKQGIYSADKVTSTGINAYILWLEKEGCASTTISRYIATMKSYFQYMLQMKLIDSDPAMLIKGPVIEKKEPKVLSVEEIDRLLNQPVGDTPKLIRDKAMLELLYATGIRVSELINLKVEDVNLDLGYIVCCDKTKERIVPFGIPAKKAMVRYMNEARDEMVKGETELMFVNCSGGSMSRQGFWKIIKHYGDMAGIEKDITPHTIRHSFAYHLVHNGANIQAVKEMMGHSVVSTTQRYANMKQIEVSREYAKAHPREKSKQ